MMLFGHDVYFTPTLAEISLRPVQLPVIIIFAANLAAVTRLHVNVPVHPLYAHGYMYSRHPSGRQREHSAIELHVSISFEH